LLTLLKAVEFPVFRSWKKVEKQNRFSAMKHSFFPERLILQTVFAA
jgi:hypothetical protein